ncbi:uncharacterized protein MELLADRAFT_115940 [Melampsora larici-populina 98AG31]|uniref:RING-type domain-containing protein n=1 Tax=Melampsora larici-populina (strain 98AG31 / pathotype 3-4-7) TaxID=747676 RepID=F4RFV8_MELLP|nr:uncharacterized protein MELLADRAFT_115940 [Melampsora larici-populina 98AG31]EGG08418.1 hypothetical protein MELLADRAFT_115940 [Melampsora larici-populina 98AG31]
MTPPPIQLPDESSSPNKPQPIQRKGESKSQTIDRLSTELNVMKMSKIHAERKLRELEDTIRTKEQLSEVSRSQCEAAWDTISELKEQLSVQSIIIKRLKEDAESFPLSSPGLMRSHHQLSTIIDTLRECLTCPLCYDGLERSEAVSLGCGHTFCQNCIESWAKSSNNPTRNPPNQPTRSSKPYEANLVQCPECRTEGSHRIRLYMLEESIRLISRAEKERKVIEDEEVKRRLKLEVVDVDEIPKSFDLLSDPN